jgi:hypothetical protein
MMICRVESPFPLWGGVGAGVPRTHALSSIIRHNSV